MNDSISRQAAIAILDQYSTEEMHHYMETLDPGMDPRSTQICYAAVDAVATIKHEIMELPPEDIAVRRLYEILDETCKDIRERYGDEAVCGLCQWDGPEWMECPGYETDECFCMKNEIRTMCGVEEVSE